MKLEYLNEWAEKFTLPLGEERSEQIIGNKANKAISDLNHHTYTVIHSYDKFEQLILSQEEAALVLFATKAQPDDLSTLEIVSDQVGDFINCVNFIVQDEKLFMDTYSGNLPQFRTFKNRIVGQRKKDQSYEIQFQGNEKANEKFEIIIGEVQYNFEADVKEVTEQMWAVLTAQYINDETNPKHSVAYLYNDDKGAHFMLKAMS